MDRTKKPELTALLAAIGLASGTAASICQPACAEDGVTGKDKQFLVAEKLTKKTAKNGKSYYCTHTCFTNCAGLGEVRGKKQKKGAKAAHKAPEKAAEPKTESKDEAPAQK